MKRRKKPPQIFSTSLLDMLFCALGGIYLLFIIASALISSVVQNGFTLTAKILPVETEIKEVEVKTYLENSFITFGFNDQYISENNTTDSLNISVYNSSQTSKDFRTTVLMHHGEFQLGVDIIKLYAENPFLSKINNTNTKVNLNLYMQGYLVDNSTYNFTSDVLFENQHPRRKNPLIPLKEFTIKKDRQTNGYMLQEVQ